MKNAFLVKGDRVAEEIAPTVTKEIENFRVDLIGVGPGDGVRSVETVRRRARSADMRRMSPLAGQLVGGSER
jgi:hypothetical protein